MRVLTYNLLGGQDDDAARLADATLLLRAAQPDLLVLNECTLLAGEHGALLRQLEAELGMQAQLALAPSGYHVALLARAAEIADVHLLGSGLTHAAVVADVRFSSRKLRVIATHLDAFSADQRVREVELLARYLSAEGPDLLIGDLNAISPCDTTATDPTRWVERYQKRHLDAAGKIDTRAIELLERSGLVDVHAALHPQTMPTRPSARYARADRPTQRLDYIFASSQLARAARVCEPYQHVHAQTASDHLPLYADFEAEV